MTTPLDDDTPPQPRRVLITGGNGELGTVLRARLPTFGWTVRSLGLERGANQGDEHVVGSVTDPGVMRAAVRDVDAVVHLGGISRPGSAWRDYLDVNIDGTRNVLEAARLGGVPRMLLSSSNHAAGYHHRGRDELPADVPVRPDSLYAVSKAAIEALGSFYADEYGLGVVNARIGSCFERPTMKRHLATWLSYGDLTLLTHSALTAPLEGTPTVWGISANTRRWWSLEAGHSIGYHPRDDAEVFARNVADPDSDHVGGSAPPAR